jgi:iron-sulfur cluster repair protein YtfE (RIC family)
MTTFQNDMTMMYAIHDAFRRTLDRIASVTARMDDDPKQILRTAAGWEMFKSYLHAHHTSEDDLLWPPVRKALPDNAYATALLNEMEAEHASVDSLIAAVDKALADRDSGPAQLGELTDALATALGGHLDHEEKEGLPVIDPAITAQQWQAFSAEGGRLIAGDVSRFMPWVLDGADPHITATVLGLLPPPVLQAYRDQWQPAYTTLRLWG